MATDSEKDPEDDDDDDLSSGAGEEVTVSRGKSKASRLWSAASSQPATSSVPSSAASAITHPDLRQTFIEVRISGVFVLSIFYS